MLGSADGRGVGDQFLVEAVENQPGLGVVERRRQQLPHPQLERASKDRRVLRQVQCDSLNGRKVFLQLAGDALRGLGVFNVQKDHLWGGRTYSPAQVIARWI